MGLLDPTSAAEKKRVKPLADRIDGIEGKTIGLLGNGKQAAEPVLNVVEETLSEMYTNIAFDYHLVGELNLLKQDSELERIQEWANEEVDVGITAYGDCGSCTKFLAWGTDAMEEAGVPAVGLLDEGFVLDWKSNAIEWGRPLRYQTTPVRSEETNINRVRRAISEDVIRNIEQSLTQPLSDEERGGKIEKV